MLRTSRQRFALACSALRFQAATPQTPIVRRQKADAAAAGVEAPLTPAELALPGELAPVFKTFNAFHRVVGPGGDSSGGLPRCAWGYLFRLSCIMWDLTNAHMTNDSNNNANMFASKTSALSSTLQLRKTPSERKHLVLRKTLFLSSVCNASHFNAYCR
jgi:hypothetical protein